MAAVVCRWRGRGRKQEGKGQRRRERGKVGMDRKMEGNVRENNKGYLDPEWWERYPKRTRFIIIVLV